MSAALEHALSKSLSRLPADRYETAAEFAAALARAEDGNSAVSGPTEIQPAATAASGQPVRRMSRLQRLARVAPWAVAVLALGAAVLGWLRPGSEMPVPVSPEVAPLSVEVSTAEFQQILAAEQAIVLDTRPHLEYAISHIPGALNVAARPGVPMSMYISDVAEISRLVGGELTRPLVLYCNGPLCPRSKRISGELEAAGFANVRRYQLGIPIWRAFGGVTVIEAEGLRHVLSLDHTAVVVDARERESFKGGSLPAAVNLPRSAVIEGKDVGEIRTAKDDGRLPMSDHNTRVIVVGRTAGDARFVAQAIANEAFHNVAYFPGTFEEASAALKP